MPCLKVVYCGVYTYTYRPAVYNDGSLVGTVVLGESAVELQQREGSVGDLVVPPRGELVVGDVVNATSAEGGLDRGKEGERERARFETRLSG